LVRSSPSKIFRPEANKSVFASAFRVQGANALALGRQILLYSPALKSKHSLSASEMDAPALGSHFCSLSSAGVTDAPASGSRFLPFQRWRSSASVQWVRQRQGANFCSLFKRSTSAMDDVREAELPYYASALGPNSYYSP
jgi:hypothetical protein